MYILHLSPPYVCTDSFTAREAILWRSYPCSPSISVLELRVECASSICIPSFPYRSMKSGWIRKAVECLKYSGNWADPLLGEKWTQEINKRENNYLNIGHFSCLVPCLPSAVHMGNLCSWLGSIMGTLFMERMLRINSVEHECVSNCLWWIAVRSD